jgi:16S rRNA (guanine(966)-N(2))-methyltransferase RsmD
MRVIAGSAKGTRLGPVPPGVRPVSDRAREGLFSSLGDAVVGARVLDLYAGVGSLGIEALSRGAERAVFVERHRAAIRALRGNLERTRVSSRADVVAGDVLRFVRGDDNRASRFEVVLADPPYDEPPERVDALLAGLELGRLTGRWRVALTRRTGSSTPVIPVHWLLSRGLEYGDTAVLIFREA